MFLNWFLTTKGSWKGIKKNLIERVKTVVKI